MQQTIDRMMQRLLHYVPEMQDRLAREEATLREAPDASYFLHVDEGQARLIRLPATHRTLAWAVQHEDELLRIVRVAAPEAPEVRRAVERTGDGGSWFLLTPFDGAVRAIGPADVRSAVDAAPHRTFVVERLRGDERTELYRGPDYEAAHGTLADARGAEPPGAGAPEAGAEAPAETIA